MCKGCMKIKNTLVKPTSISDNKFGIMQMVAQRSEDAKLFVDTKKSSGNASS